MSDFNRMDDGVELLQRNDPKGSKGTTSAKDLTSAPNSSIPEDFQHNSMPVSSSSALEEVQSLLIEDSPTKTGVRKIISNPINWKANIRKRKHQAGQAYTSRSGKLIPAKKINTTKNCLENCKFKCLSKISGDEREELFSSYYLLSSNEKRHFILNNTERRLTARPKRLNAGETRKRTHSYFYYFIVKNEKIQVCKRFFLDTLDISQTPIYTVHENKNPNTNTPHSDNRGKSIGSRRSPKGDVNFAREHIKSFPRVESHYCRSQSKREYLGADLNISKMYDMFYLIKCQESGSEPVKESMYRHLFVSEFNLGFHRPKKDRCDLCEKYKAAKKINIGTDALDAEYMRHQVLKTAMRTLRKRQKEEAVPVLLFDLENVITCPRAEISSFFYYRKLNLYNLTAYYSVTKKVYCALWPETMAGRGGNDIASALVKILKCLVEENDVTELNTWSDSCIPQNKNSVMAYAMLDFMRNNNILKKITMNYSIPGHSCVQEVDNAHGQIEKALAREEFYSPLGVVRILKKINRINPFKVIQMKDEDFIDFASAAKLLNYKTIPFSKVFELNFTQKLYEISYKTSHESDEEQKFINLKYSITARKMTGKSSVEILPKTERNKKVISDEKKKDIKRMLPFMPESDRQYYISVL